VARVRQNAVLNPVEDDYILPVMKLSKDLKAAAAQLGAAEVRFLVDDYYIMQESRIRAAGQIRSMERAPEQEPHGILTWSKGCSEIHEGQIKAALNIYAKSKDMGRWLMSIHGIGPVIASGLLAHIDWTKPTVGHIWRFAGLDPTSKWVKGERRPWNASLKTLCWKVGESFIKVQNKPKDTYGKEYAIRKQYEVTGNDDGRFADQAKVRATQVKPATESYKWYTGQYPAGTTAAYMALASIFEKQQLITERAKLLTDRRLKAGEGLPMLSPPHINSRARRYAVKLFLSHAHFTGLFLTTGRLAPNPYPIAHCGHAHVIAPPNLDEIVGLRAAWEERQRLG
jgi:hypothetical protein